MLIKGQIHQENIVILNNYTPNAQAYKFTKEKLLHVKLHIVLHIVIVGNFNTPPHSYQQTGHSRQRHNREMLDLNYIINLVHIYIISHTHIKEYILFSASHGKSSKTDDILEYKARLKRCKKIEATSYILSCHHRLKLDVNNSGTNRNFINSCKLNNLLLNEGWFKTELRQKLKSYQN